MDKIVFSKSGHMKFMAYYNRIKDTLQRTTKEKARAGSEQDSWHDEGFKVGIGDEMMWSQKFGELQQILMNCQIVTPLEQDKEVRIGNGVITEDASGEKRTYILDGYLVEPFNNLISIYSPLGRAFLGKKKDDEVKVKIVGVDKVYYIDEILLPSAAQKL